MRSLDVAVNVRLDQATVRRLRMEGDVVDPPRSLSYVIRHVLDVHAAEVERWLAGEGPRPTTMLPRGEFDDFIEQHIRERIEYIAAGGPRIPDREMVADP